MLLNLYIIILVSALLFFTAGIYLGCSSKSMGLEASTKKGVIMLLLLIATIFFIITAYESLNIEKEYCFNCCETMYNESYYEQQVPPLLLGNLQNASIGNITIYSFISCQTTRHSSEALAGIMGFMVILSIIFLFYYSMSKV